MSILNQTRKCDIMNIDNFRNFYSYKVMERGKSYYRNNRIINFYKADKNNYSASVKGSNNERYSVNLYIQSDGEILSLDCNCPYFDSRRYCKHSFAVLMTVEDIFEDEISLNSSNNIAGLIAEYTQKALTDIDSEKVHIEPEITNLYEDLYFKLKIGKDKTYVVNNIADLVNHFEYGYRKRYGKNLEFTHTYSALDPKSRKIMELAYSIYRESDGYYNSAKEFKLHGTNLERFLEIYGCNSLIIGGEIYHIVKKNPLLNIILKSDNNDRLTFSLNNHLYDLGQSTNSYFLSPDEKILYVTNNEFAETVKPIVNTVRETNLYIGKSDIPAFYNTVVKQLKKYADIKTVGLKKDIIPPQLVTRLYIDVDDINQICAKLEFVYDDKIYSDEYYQVNNPFCDLTGELLSKNLILKYFKSEPSDDNYNFVITNDKDIFQFITEGMTELSQNMELYVSDRFNRINVRQSIRPCVGVKISGNLLELDISATGYSNGELLELLQAYRKGKKYHRFKDGSFTVINDGLNELNEVTKELNITDREFLKKNIAVPMYRMLYIDSLQNNLEALRIKRNRDFRKLIDTYKNSIEDIDSITIPEHLNNIMRDYQKYGVEWLSTLAKYHLGGILADDMGLGKTLQSIALMLNAKENSDKHNLSLVVCPSSLTLNWENEIQKFAPTLKTLCLTGTVAERNSLFETINNYDVIITSYATMIRDIDKYEKIHFNIQFLDEAQNIKNHNTAAAKSVKAIKSDIRFALTGTPIENSLAELWSIFDFIMPGYLYNYSYFKKNFETPIVKKNDEKSVAALQRLTSPFILRRLKKNVLTELPEKTETVLYTTMSSEQQKIYTANVAQIKGELQTLNDMTDKIKILAMLTRLRQLCCDPTLVYDNYNGGSAKLEQCIELIKSCIDAKHKILLFSQFTSMLEHISKILDSNNISYYTLTGKTKPSERIRLVNEFNKNDTNVFLISLKAGGTGLNLTGADIVIHFDPWWNISAENQASDRAYRIGQKNNVQIYKLIVKNTIEEKIRILQQRKADLFDTAVGGDSDIMKMSAEDVMSLLE